MNAKDPFYLPLEPQSETGKAIRDGNKGAADTGTHPWDDSEPIPLPPERDLGPTGDEVKGGISDRARAAANLKVDGFSYQEIADMLEFRDAATAKREVERVLSLTHSTDDYDTLRIVAAARAESQLRRSIQWASADYLVVVDEDGREQKVPNDKKLQWHQQAGADLVTWANITGAKAPTKVEITPDLEMMDQLVAKMLSASGHEDIMDAEVIELDALEALPYADPGEDDPDDEP